MSKLQNFFARRSTPNRGSGAVDEDAYAYSVLAGEVPDDSLLVHPQQRLARRGRRYAERFAQRVPSLHVRLAAQFRLEAQHAFPLPILGGRVDEPQVYLTHQRRDRVGLAGGHGRDGVGVYLAEVPAIFAGAELSPANEPPGFQSLSRHNSP